MEITLERLQLMESDSNENIATTIPAQLDERRRE